MKKATKKAFSGERSTGLRDIAAATGYSLATVSWALRGMTRVPESTRRKIRRAADRLGYRPDPKMAELAAHVRRGKSHLTGETLAIIVPYPADPISGPSLLTQGRMARAEELGYRAEEFPINETQGGYSLPFLHEVLQARNIRGILVSSLIHPVSLEAFDWSRYFAVASAYTLQRPNLHRVCSHHFQSLLLTCRKMEERGYRRIGLILDTSLDIRVNRLWHAAYLLHGIEPGVEAIPPLIEHPLTRTGIQRWIRKHRPDGLISIGIVPRDLIRESLEAMGMRIPRDIGFAGLHVSPDQDEWAGIDQDDLE
ncbi:MAG: LacI family DNA-binding transcriptional regulator, partial [Kiritimatiellia bacterium]|nr:LacI family DNA-binding transcriptional regulator [Kiritimatiellia bacterium]